MSALSKVDWSALATKLKPETFALVSKFRARHAALTKQVQELSEQKAIDFALYEGLKNQTVVSEAKKAISGFKPVKYDLAGQLKVIEEARAEDIALAKQTVETIKKEQVELKELLVNIENARPIDQLLVDDIAKAYPKLDETVQKMAKRGQWRVPGYYEKFGEFTIGF